MLNLPLLFRNENLTNKPPGLLFKALLSLLLLACLPFLVKAQNPIPPNLGSAANFGLLSGAGITSNQPVYVYGSVGAAGTIDSLIASNNGTIYDGNDSPVPQALAYLDSAKGYCNSLSGASISNVLSGQVLTEGVYYISGASMLSATYPLTLSGDTSSIFILNFSDSLQIAADALVILDGVLSKNVYWNISSDLKIGNNSIFHGIVLSGGVIRKSGSLSGSASLLGGNSVELLDIDSEIGHNFFYSQLSFFQKPQHKYHAISVRPVF